MEFGCEMEKRGTGGLSQAEYGGAAWGWGVFGFVACGLGGRRVDWFRSFGRVWFSEGPAWLEFAELVGDVLELVGLFGAWLSVRFLDGCGIGFGEVFCDDDGLGVEELSHAGGGEFPAVAGTLGATEREARIAGDGSVEEDGSGLEFDGEALAFSIIGGPGAGGEAEGRVVGEGDGFVEGGDAEEQGDGAKEFFLGDGSVAHDTGDDGGLEVIAEATAFHYGA